MTEKVEYCQRIECKAVNATVEWEWDKEMPGAWGEKCCTNCGFRYSAVTCPYIPGFTDEQIKAANEQIELVRAKRAAE